MKVIPIYSLRLLLTLNLVVLLVYCILTLTCDNEKQIKKLKKEVSYLQDIIDGENEKSVNEELLPTIYAITPTYARWTQKADLTRLSQTLLHVKNFHWIVVEDADRKTLLVTKFLSNCGLKYTHLNAKTDQNFKLKDSDPNWLMPRGVAQRNTGLTWIRNNISPQTEGYLYFMDDDNTYDLQLFKEIRTTQLASAWPVGLSGGLKFEGPGFCKDGKVLSWYTAWKPERPFPIDMAGFAVNIKLLFQYKEAGFSNATPRGYLESHFLTGLHLTINDMEAKANQCTDILVWHTRTEKAKMKQEDKLIKLGKPSNPNIEV
uniref:Galactosylgalactosylxylosylprotein 3-beta-glucuronosyltransferase n=1 Tax=Phallusia mammillata TaxID=59560 RepID=A0A6F9D7V4_9ASCI|nr:beta-1,3-glucuronosyltransferase [Phallusia mammillata]